MTDRIEVKQKIREYVVANFLFGEASDLVDNSSFLDRGIIDSTGVLELVAFVEAEFGIKVQDAELTPDNLDSVEAVAGYIERKLTETQQQPTTPAR